MFSSWHSAPDVRLLVLWRDKGLVSYGEFWPDASCDEIALARLIVKPSARGL